MQKLSIQKRIKGGFQAFYVIFWSRGLV